ncbi:MAG: glycosyltransferase family 4 protein [Desulfobacteraceae bacterium]|nr:glycosyltransferase family 4 protein [Desulfobacteraceae bacterium]
MAKIAIVGSFAESVVSFRGPLLKEIVDHGHIVFACVPNAGTEIKNQLAKMGVQYQDIRINRTGMNPFQDFLTLIGLFNLFKRIQPDIVLCYTVKPVIYGSIAAKIAGVPNIYSMITGLGYAFIGEKIKNRVIGKIVQLLYRFGLKGNRYVFFQNKDDLSLFRALDIIKTTRKGILINGSGVDLNFYKTASFPPKISFLLIARLLIDKGVREYVEAARLIKKDAPDVKFNIAGWIDDNPACISETELLEWINQGYIEYLGKLNDVRSAIESSSVYVLPSYREGMPRTVLEAMSMGRPVITTDAPGCRETVKEGENGFLVPVKDVDELKLAMEKFISNPNLIHTMGKKSNEIARDKFDVKKVNHKMLEIMGL